MTHMYHLIYNVSRTLTDAPKTYNTTKKELAVVFALDKFCSYLLYSEVAIFTDHATLKYLLSKKERVIGKSNAYSKSIVSSM